MSTTSYLLEKSAVLGVLFFFELLLGKLVLAELWLSGRRQCARYVGFCFDNGGRSGERCVWLGDVLFVESSIQRVFRLLDRFHELNDKQNGINK